MKNLKEIISEKLILNKTVKHTQYYLVSGIHDSYNYLIDTLGEENEIIPEGNFFGVFIVSHKVLLTLDQDLLMDKTVSSVFKIPISYNINKFIKDYKHNLVDIKKFFINKKELKKIFTKKNETDK